MLEDAGDGLKGRYSVTKLEERSMLSEDCQVNALCVNKWSL